MPTGIRHWVQRIDVRQLKPNGLASAIRLHAHFPLASFRPSRGRLGEGHKAR
jgi:hypothetical protein